MPGAPEGVCKSQLLLTPGAPQAPRLQLLSLVQSCCSKLGGQGYGLQRRWRLEAAEASLWPPGSGDPRRTGGGRYRLISISGDSGLQPL